MTYGTVDWRGTGAGTVLIALVVFCVSCATTKTHGDTTSDEPSTPAASTANKESDVTDESEEPAPVSTAMVSADMDRAAAADTVRNLSEVPSEQPGVMLELRTTLDYGCPCPTWTLAALHNGPHHGVPYIMVLPADGVTDPTDHAVAGGLYRMYGAFDGRSMTGAEWAKARGSEPPNFPDATPPREEYWEADASPVFVVDYWCYHPTDGSRDDAVSRLEAAGVDVCTSDEPARPLAPRLKFGGHVRQPLDSHVIRDEADFEALVDKVPAKKVVKKQPGPDNDDPILDQPSIDFDEEMVVVAACPTFYCKAKIVGIRHEDGRQVIVVSLPGEGPKSEYYARPYGIGHYRAVVVPRAEGPIEFEYRGPGQRPGE